MVARLHAPNFWGFEKLYWDLVKNTPDWMKRPGFMLSHAYGCFPGMVWNGGRPQNPTQLEGIRDIVEKEIAGYTKLGIKPELTCNNISLLEEDFLDPYCNDILQVWEQYGLTVIVAMPSLADYIKETFPGIRLKRSCVAWKLNTPKCEYDLFVLDQFQGNNEKVLMDIPWDFRDKIELVANIECIDNCPQFARHHKTMSDLQRWGQTNKYFQCPLKAKIARPLPMYHSKRNGHYISPERALELDAWGFHDFKLVSRCYLGQALNSIIDYYIKPEFKDDALARAYQCFGVPRRIGEPVDYKFLIGEENLDNDTREFLQIR